MFEFLIKKKAQFQLLNIIAMPYLMNKTDYIELNSKNTRILIIKQHKIHGIWLEKKKLNVN